ncbi:MAG TPA: glycoside hydrolase family 2 TIM barrel-domain containing protein, partial [Solirubrobacteraceae bacterium]|nr:glycoside hydrolase family 2 TIM barrel-domain containing protein [Solirubrobacteraceae bacterium]
MTRQPLLLALLIALAALMAAPAAQAQTAERPDRRALYHNGPNTRYLLDGEWLFRLDEAGVGLDQRFFDGASQAGWTPTAVPNAWNATDQSTASMTGTVGWYRKDFRLPSSAKRFDWVVRFESVNYRTRAWLNGKEIGSNTGASLPFELRLRDDDLRRRGTNRLVVRIDNRRLATDFPPSGLIEDGTPAGGWWNYGGILREVYLRRVDHVDVSSVRVLPKLRSNGDADVQMRVVVRNHDSSSREVAVRGFFAGRSISLGSARVRPRSLRSFTRTLRVRNPKLWSPTNPNLYNATFRVSTLGAERVRWQMRTGIREIEVDRGRLLLNGKRVNFRGVGLHEDDLQKGFAIDNVDRREIVRNVQELGATLMRAHYPLHPYLHELADRKGIMVWSEIPVYHIKTEYLR